MKKFYCVLLFIGLVGIFNYNSLEAQTPCGVNKTKICWQADLYTKPLIAKQNEVVHIGFRLRPTGGCACQCSGGGNANCDVIDHSLRVLTDGGSNVQLATALPIRFSINRNTNGDAYIDLIFPKTGTFYLEFKIVHSTGADIGDLNSKLSCTITIKPNIVIPPPVPSTGTLILNECFSINTFPIKWQDDNLISGRFKDIQFGVKNSSATVPVKGILKVFGEIGSDTPELHTEIISLAPNATQHIVVKPTPITTVVTGDPVFGNMYACIEYNETDPAKVTSNSEKLGVENSCLNPKEFAIYAPYIDNVKVNGNSSTDVRSNEALYLTWDSNVDDDVKIELFEQGSMALVFVISGGATNTMVSNLFQWTVSDVIPSGNYYAKITSLHPGEDIFGVSQEISITQDADFNIKPVANILVPANVCVGNPFFVQYDASQGGTPLTYTWNFGEAKKIPPAPAFPFGPYQIIFNTPGTQKIGVYVKNNGGYDTKVVEIQVLESGCQGDFSYTEALDFKKCEIGYPKAMEFNLTNNTNFVANIEFIPPRDFSVSNCSNLINPGEKLNCQLVFNPTQEATYDKTMLVNVVMSNGKIKPLYILVKGSGYKASSCPLALYRLPYPKDRTYPVSRSTNHPIQMAHAIDFVLGFGDAICAARDGEVLEIVQNFLDYTDHCVPVNNECGACGNNVNYIKIRHDDGSIGIYLHIMHNSALIATHTKVVQGQPIAQCGYNGCSTGPHLHFHVQNESNTWYGNSIEVRFLDVRENCGLIETNNSSPYTSCNTDLYKPIITPLSDFQKMPDGITFKFDLNNLPDKTKIDKIELRLRKMKTSNDSHTDNTGLAIIPLSFDNKEYSIYPANTINFNFGTVPNKLQEGYYYRWVVSITDFCGKTVASESNVFGIAPCKLPVGDILLDGVPDWVKEKGNETVDVKLSDNVTLRPTHESDYSGYNAEWHKGSMTGTIKGDKLYLNVPDFKEADAGAYYLIVKDPKNENCFRKGGVTVKTIKSEEGCSSIYLTSNRQIKDNMVVEGQGVFVEIATDIQGDRFIWYRDDIEIGEYDNIIQFDLTPEMEGHYKLKVFGNEKCFEGEIDVYISPPESNVYMNIYDIYDDDPLDEYPTKLKKLTEKVDITIIDVTDPTSTKHIATYPVNNGTLLIGDFKDLKKYEVIISYKGDNDIKNDDITLKLNNVTIESDLNKISFPLSIIKDCRKTTKMLKEYSIPINSNFYSNLETSVSCMNNIGEINDENNIFKAFNYPIINKTDGEYTNELENYLSDWYNNYDNLENNLTKLTQILILNAVTLDYINRLSYSNLNRIIAIQNGIKVIFDIAKSLIMDKILSNNKIVTYTKISKEVESKLISREVEIILTEDFIKIIKKTTIVKSLFTSTIYKRTFENEFFDAVSNFCQEQLADLIIKEGINESNIENIFKKMMIDFILKNTCFELLSKYKIASHKLIHGQYDLNLNIKLLNAFYYGEKDNYTNIFFGKTACKFIGSNKLNDRYSIIDLIIQVPATLVKMDVIWSIVYKMFQTTFILDNIEIINECDDFDYNTINKYQLIINNI